DLDRALALYQIDRGCALDAGRAARCGPLQQLERELQHEQRAVEGVELAAALEGHVAREQHRVRDEQQRAGARPAGARLLELEQDVAVSRSLKAPLGGESCLLLGHAEEQAVASSPIRAWLLGARRGPCGLGERARPG